MLSKDSLSDRVIYDSSNAKMQWRCHLRTMKGDATVPITCLIMVALALVIKPLTYTLIMAAVFIACLPFAIIYLTVTKRCQSERICTTSISGEGVRDITPDSDKTLPWEAISSVETHDGDIFFITRTGGVFVPGSAFETKERAQTYVGKARQLWAEAHGAGDRNQKTMPSSKDQSKASAGERSTKEIEQLLAQEDPVWLALDEEHKKQQHDNDTTSGGT
jgi:hypothetical protein